ncbi:hypothetical protein [Chitinophaga sp. sic0106]|uniref:hypothetical protein n=1 Tax=Chitinophaga sp. sic0106 TaxID=2854785 RepID=UPI001C4692F1|nr:hypothetical protein [Chitinophaga sp. sic0106]MBV7531582.1 hypothetical protein [Chitinophaga sp. sic0106]
MIIAQFEEDERQEKTKSQPTHAKSQETNINIVIRRNPSQYRPGQGKGQIECSNHPIIVEQHFRDLRL